MNKNEYQCSMCKNIYKKINNKTWSDEKAWDETQHYWKGVKKEECQIICDDCFQKFHPKDHPIELMISNLKFK